MGPEFGERREVRVGERGRGPESLRVVLHGHSFEVQGEFDERAACAFALWIQAAAPDDAGARLAATEVAEHAKRVEAATDAIGGVTEGLSGTAQNSGTHA